MVWDKMIHKSYKLIHLYNSINKKHLPFATIYQKLYIGIWEDQSAIPHP